MEVLRQFGQPLPEGFRYSSIESLINQGVNFTATLCRVRCGKGSCPGLQAGFFPFSDRSHPVTIRLRDM